MKTDNGKALPKRKSTRLKSFDYSAAGIYFITICTRDRMQILSEIVRVSLADADRPIPVGEGLAPPETVGERLSSPPTVGEGLAPPEIAVRLKPCGEIAEEKRLKNKTGNATFRTDLIDAVFNLTEQELKERIRYEVYEG